MQYFIMLLASYLVAGQVVIFPGETGFPAFVMIVSLPFLLIWRWKTHQPIISPMVI
jgi:hypothetical protein